MILKVCGIGATKLVLGSLPNDINEVRNQCIFQLTLEEILKEYGEIVNLELTTGSKTPYGSKCTVTYKHREQAVDAMIGLEDNRCIGTAKVPMSIRLYDELQAENAEEVKSTNQEQIKDTIIERKPTVNVNIRPTAPMLPTGLQGQAVVYIEYITAQGNPYYYNTVTQKTQWEVPPANAIVMKPNGEPKNLPGYIQSIPTNAKDINMPKFNMVQYKINIEKRAAWLQCIHIQHTARMG